MRQLNSASPVEAENTLRTCCGSTRWAHRVAEHRPYPDTAALLAAAEEAGYDMTRADLQEALAQESPQHPATEGPGALAAHTALRAAHAAYEARFGHTFVICLDDVRPAERLDRALVALHRRLGHDPEQEHAVVAEELRLLTLSRLTRLLGPQVPDPARVRHH
ncbi:hypothetical protein AN216_11070 [Streptomyces oceani]|uniref:Oxo-4-hydroxy-4-carboxy-5-ureidoimidazoline decarboxylase domain-containing protein n=1 Tax=Streptomyces oceani TaxID=1075402 RepID=A0A1E7KIC8_9ACTN|nr:hypothetical protein AN216_11070 [Streptomyces oceani]